MVSFASQISILLLLFLSATIFHKSMSSNHGVVRCNEKDRQILLIFKRGVIDPSNLLSTWSSEKDCCAWKGVQCDDTTGRVTKLDLNKQVNLQGEINFSLLELEFLNYLDLSVNDFEAITIPPVRDNITLATSLHYLDLSFNDLHMDNLHWLSRLSSLKYLKLSGIDLHKETNWLQLVTMLPSLSELRFGDCNLNNISPSLKYVNFTSLVTLDLSGNNFDSELPYWLFNLSNGISHLKLQQSSLHGEIPSSLLNFRNLQYLDISRNQLKGSIPDWIGKQEHLQDLDLSYNMFSGSIPSTVGNLSSLVTLYIGSNSFSGAVSETIFSKLYNLKDLEMGNTNFSFHFDPQWIPPFQLSDLTLVNTNQGPYFPSWIYTQKSLQALDISNSGISFVDGDMFRSFIAGNYFLLYMSHNSISEDISNVTLNSSFIKLDHNNFTGGLPHISPNALHVDLSHNSFSGSIPRGWENLKHLEYMNLWSNRLSGEVPADLSNLTQLKVMHLRQNEFSGTIPIKWPQTIQVMILRSNQFEGNIPPQLFNLSSLFYLDLAHNKLSGSMPQSMYSMTGMITDNENDFLDDNIVDLFTKGQHYEYNLKSLRQAIDLSANNLSGEIPVELFGLIKVQTLNLSYNHLTGKIPKTIGGIKNLESLDLSNNKLSGEIPQSMAVLSFLSYLNLSCNNFSGQIPTGTQLQSFDPSSYIGNPELCGDPLAKCGTIVDPKEPEQHAGNEDGDPERKSLYLGMGVGFAVGFWGLCGSLFLYRKWRHTYYRFLDRVADQLYVTFMVKFNNFRKTEAPAS